MARDRRRQVCLFVRGDGVWSVAVSSAGSTLRFGVPTQLFGGVRRAASAAAETESLAVWRDGSRFFWVQGVEQPDAGVIH